MHSAPSVSYPVGRCRLAAASMAMLWMLGGAGLGGWLLQGAPVGPVFGSACAIWAAAGIFAAVSWKRTPVDLLAWDGAGWRFGAAEAGAPRVTLDLQDILLLELPLGVRGAWLWVERGAAPSDWEALRRAVYSRAGAGMPQGAEPPVSAP